MKDVIETSAVGLGFDWDTNDSIRSKWRLIAGRWADQAAKISPRGARDMLETMQILEYYKRIHVET